MHISPHLRLNKIFAIVYLSPLQATEYYGDLQAPKGAAAKMG